MKAPYCIQIDAMAVLSYRVVEKRDGVTIKSWGSFSLQNAAQQLLGHLVAAWSRGFTDGFESMAEHIEKRLENT